MNFSSTTWAILLTVVVILLGYGFFLRYLASRSRPLALTSFLLIRLAAFLLVAGLIWYAFVNLQERREDESPPAPEPMQVLVVQDGSASMTFQTAPRRTRADLLNRTRQDLERAIDDLPADQQPEVQWLWFGANVVPETQRDALQIHATNLNLALGVALGRFQCDRLLVLSDGRSTDGAVPAYLRDWSRNRGLPVYAVCPGTPDESDLPDLKLTRVDNLPLNPDRVQVQSTVQGSAKAGSQARLRLEIDGTEVAERQVTMQPDQVTRFDLPDLPLGWHALRVEAKPDLTEITARNNHQVGIFRMTPPNRILFLYGSPRLEDFHFGRLLRQQYSDIVDIHSYRSTNVQDLKWESYRLVVLGGIPPEHLPAVLHRHIKDQTFPLLLLGGEQLAAWGPYLRATRVLPDSMTGINLIERLNSAGRVAVASGVRQAVFRDLDLSELSLNLLYTGRLPDRSKIILNVDVGKQHFPLLLADQVDAPRLAVVLADTTWKWSLHPDPLTRQQYRTFWTTLVTWLTGETGERAPLMLEAGPSPDDPLRTRLSIRPVNALALPNLRDVRLQLGRHREETVTPEKGEETYYYDLPVPDVPPDVVWARAVANHRSEAWTSEQRPFILDVPNPEMTDTRTDPDLLRALVQEPSTDFAFSHESDAIIERLLEPPPPAEPTIAGRHRQAKPELLLAAIVTLLLAAEWYLERRFYQRMGS